MLVATFGPTTGWPGREIIWDVDRFILVGHGAVPAAGVLDYDRLGQLVWASPELRSWVASVAHWEAGGQPASPGRPASTAGSAPAKARRLPTWAIVLIIIAVLLVVLAAIIGAVVPSLIIRTTETITYDAAVRAGVRDIQVGVESYAAEHSGAYPAADEVSSVGLSRYITVWPQNPYTDLAMAPGTGPGCFVYERSADGAGYRLAGYGRNGTLVIDLSGGSGAQTY
jgi:hypothetical protein